MASANTHKQQRSCDCVHQRIHPAMWWHCRNNCQDELPIVSSAQLIPNIEHVRELFVHEHNVYQLLSTGDSNPCFPPLSTVFEWCCEGRTGGFWGVQVTQQHGACLLHLCVFFVRNLIFLSWDHSWVLIPQSSYVQKLRKKVELLNKWRILFNPVFNFPMLGVDLVPPKSTKYQEK